MSGIAILTLAFCVCNIDPTELAAIERPIPTSGSQRYGDIGSQVMKGPTAEMPETAS
jgi:hypothetical protein